MDTDTHKLAVLAEIRRMFEGNEAGAQRRRVQEVLERGYSLNTDEARRYLDVLHPAGRVKELRKAGANIATHWTPVVTEAGVTHRVGKYFLVREGSHAA